MSGGAFDLSALKGKGGPRGKGPGKPPPSSSSGAAKKKEEKDAPKKKARQHATAALRLPELHVLQRARRGQPPQAAERVSAGRGHVGRLRHLMSRPVRRVLCVAGAAVGHAGRQPRQRERAHRLHGRGPFGVHGGQRERPPG